MAKGRDLSIERRRALAAGLLLATWVAVWDLAWRSSARRAARRGPEIAAVPSPPTPLAAQPSPAFGVWPHRAIVAVGVAAVCLIAASPFRLGPSAARWISAAGLLIIAAGVVAVRRTLPQSAPDRNRDALLPDPAVPDADAVDTLVRMLDERRRFPAEVRSAIFADVERLRRAPALHQYNARVALQREVLATFSDPVSVRLLRALRSVGPALLALAFIVGWTLAFLLVWSLDADVTTGAFKGFGPRAEPADAMYLAVSAAVGGTPPGFEARTNVAQTLIAAEFACGALLLGAYATSLVRAQRESQGTRSSLAAGGAPVGSR